MQCKEMFKFHLGLEDNTSDYMHDWESRTKFEASFMGHTFVARLASNPNIVVDSYTLQPTEIHDCPGLKQKPITFAAEQVIEPNGVQRGLLTGANATEAQDGVNITSRVVNVATSSQ